MFLPIGDAPNPRETPWLTYALIALNLFVFLALLPEQGARPQLEDPALAEYLQTLRSEGLLQLQVEVVAGMDLGRCLHIS